MALHFPKTPVHFFIHESSHQVDFQDSPRRFWEFLLLGFIAFLFLALIPAAILYLEVSHNQEVDTLTQSAGGKLMGSEQLTEILQRFDDQEAFFIEVKNNRPLVVDPSL